MQVTNTESSQNTSDVSETRPPLKEFSSGDKQTDRKTQAVVMAVYVVLVFLGVGTGYLLSVKTGAGGVVKVGAPAAPKVVGVTDPKAFRDSAVGVIEKNGVNGEGTHKLIREGGPSQTAYLTSSVIDLDQYVGLKVKVWGETFEGQKAGWLMDVGRLEILAQ